MDFDRLDDKGDFGVLTYTRAIRLFLADSHIANKYFQGIYAKNGSSISRNGKRAGIFVYNLDKSVSISGYQEDCLQWVSLCRKYFRLLLNINI